MSKTELSLSDLEVGSVVIRIDGLLHFYALKSDIKSVHAYVDETSPECKYTIDVLLGSGEVKLQYSDKELSSSVLGMFERVLCIQQEVHSSDCEISMRPFPLLDCAYCNLKQ